MNNNENKQDLNTKVIDIAQARKKQRKKPHKKQTNPIITKLSGFVQVILFLGLVYVFMQKCRM